MLAGLLKEIEHNDINAFIKRSTDKNNVGY